MNCSDVKSTRSDDLRVVALVIFRKITQKIVYRQYDAVLKSSETSSAKIFNLIQPGCKTFVLAVEFRRGRSGLADCSIETSGC